MFKISYIITIIRPIKFSSLKNNACLVRLPYFLIAFCCAMLGYNNNANNGINIMIMIIIIIIIII